MNTLREYRVLATDALPRKEHSSESFSGSSLWRLGGRDVRTRGLAEVGEFSKPALRLQLLHVCELLSMLRVLCRRVLLLLDVPGRRIASSLQRTDFRRRSGRGPSMPTTWGVVGGGIGVPTPHSRTWVVPVRDPGTPFVGK